MAEAASPSVVESVRLSKRYISGRQLPDKSVSLLDTAAARVGISHSATPAPIEDARRLMSPAAIELRFGGHRCRSLGRDKLIGKLDYPTYREGIRAFHKALTDARIEHVYYESPGTDHEWQTWRRNLKDFASRLFRKK